jgi:hypothetical protein
MKRGNEEERENRKERRERGRRRRAHLIDALVSSAASQLYQKMTFIALLVA